MIGYVVRRVLSAVPVLLGVTILVFSLIHLIPGDPDNFVCYFFCLDAKDTPKAAEGFFADKEVSDLLKKAAATVQKADRTPLYQQAEQMIHDKVLRLFIANNQPPLAFSAKVKGYIVNPTGTEYFNTVDIAQ